MPRLFQDTPYHEHFKQNPDTSYLEIQGKMSNSRTHMRWRQSHTSHRVDVQFLLKDIDVTLKVDPQNRSKIVFNLGQLKYQDNIANWYLGGYMKDHKLQFRIGMNSDIKTNLWQSLQLRIQEGFNMQYQLKYIHSKYQIRQQLSLGYAEVPTFDIRFELNVPYKQNEFYGRLLGSRKYIKNSWNCVGNNFGFGYIRKIKNNFIGVNIEKKDGLQFYGGYDGQRLNFKNYLNLSLQLQSYLQYKHNEDLSISAGFKLPLKHLGKTCPSKYPTGIQISFNV